MPDLTCDFLNLKLHNPIVLASGILGTSADLLERAALAGAGAVTAKSCGPAPRAGHPNPVAVEWEHGLINAIGLSNPGAEEEARMLAETRARLEPLGVVLIASIFAGTVAEFGDVAHIIARARPYLIEVNISCPNVADEFGTPFAATCESAAAVTETVKRNVGGIPISVKLAPNVPNIGRIAAAAVEAGADAITAVNTMPGMLINAEAGRPVLANRVGGLSGPALKPIALRCVYEIARTVRVPIIGTGGVITGRDAAEMLMAGATAVGVGSAVGTRGVTALGSIAAELAAFMTQEGYPTLEALRGLAL
ncbi:MAG TPA: dihydroorotate dehydrogenase [Anaerolineae bacterium]|nr:dihydroorotate dehydrogenase [Anaerolineae bacterium]HQH39495.1 dihydroorotate dehydrogenase [Anaerolineae bacterium]